MYTIQLNIDDSIFDQCMESLNSLPKDKFEFTSEKKDQNTLTTQELKNISPKKEKINELLEKHNLSHFNYFKDPDRIIYTKNNGDARNKDDYKRLVSVLQDNNINHNAIGIDVLFIEN